MFVHGKLLRSNIVITPISEFHYNVMFLTYLVASELTVLTWSARTTVYFIDRISRTGACEYLIIFIRLESFECPNECFFFLTKTLRTMRLSLTTSPGTKLFCNNSASFFSFSAISTFYIAAWKFRVRPKI